MVLYIPKSASLLIFPDIDGIMPENLPARDIRPLIGLLPPVGMMVAVALYSGFTRSKIEKYATVMVIINTFIKSPLYLARIRRKSKISVLLFSNFLFSIFTHIVQDKNSKLTRTRSMKNLEPRINLQSYKWITHVSKTRGPWILRVILGFFKKFPINLAYSSLKRQLNFYLFRHGIFTHFF